MNESTSNFHADIKAFRFFTIGELCLVLCLTNQKIAIQFGSLFTDDCKFDLFLLQLSAIIFNLSIFERTLRGMEKIRAHNP